MNTRNEIVEGINRGIVTINEPGLGDMVRQAVADGHVIAASDISKLAEADMIIVAVGTPINGEVPDITQVISACEGLTLHYGHIDQTINCEDLLPVGLAEGATQLRDVTVDEHISINDVELNEESPVALMWRAQRELFSRGDTEIVTRAWDTIRSEL